MGSVTRGLHGYRAIAAVPGVAHSDFPTVKDTTIGSVAIHETNRSVKRVLEKFEGLLEGKCKQSDSCPF